jgi:hypothetical protein
MLDAKLICEIKESERIGDELAREFKELNCAIEEGKVSNGMKFYGYLGGLIMKYDAWEKNHRELLVRAHG